MKKIIALAASFMAIVNVYAQLYRVPQQEIVAHSAHVIEGKVIETYSFWNPAGTMIYTSNTIAISKVFKGNFTNSTVEVLTVGGTVGTQSIEASELLTLQEGDVATFCLQPNELNLRSPRTNAVLWDVYASAQGCVKYNKTDGSAAAPFVRFNDVETNWYPAIQNLCGVANYRVVDANFRWKEEGVRTNNVTITSFAPTTVNAGATGNPASNLLTINGTGFGAAGGTARIAFDDCNDGTGGTPFNINSTDNTVVSWTDTQIQVRVPSRAGTGVFQVVNSLGQAANSSTNLVVNYSILTSTFTVAPNTLTKQSHLMNANGSGGYSIVYSTSTLGSGINLDNDGAKATFQRALNAWKNIVGYNVAETGTTTSQVVSGNDGLNIIMYDNTNTTVARLSAGVLAVCYSYNSTCTPITANDFQKTGFDIVIRNNGVSSGGNVAFQIGYCEPASNEIDLESVLFHELGHSLNLGHINDGLQSFNGLNPAKVMNFSISNNVKRTSPDASSLEGSIYTISHQTNGTPVFGFCGLPTVEMAPLATTAITNDECPTNFPTTPTPPGSFADFNLELATSNASRDPQFTAINCLGTGVGVTNTAFYALRTSGSGVLDITVSNLVTVPTADLFAECNSLYFELALYQVNSCPVGQNFPSPVACRNFTTNGALTSITGLAANTTYLVMVNGHENAKGSFRLTFGGQVLPLVLGSFTGIQQGLFNKLNWQIASATHVANVVLERSGNGTNFTTVAKFTAADFTAGTTGGFLDKLPLQGNNFYRLKTTNLDGTVQYSEQVLLFNKSAQNIQVWPNPVKDMAQIFIPETLLTTGKNVQAILYAANGQLIQSVRIQNTQTQLNMAALASGMYTLKIINISGEPIWQQIVQKL